MDGSEKKKIQNVFQVEYCTQLYLSRVEMAGDGSPVQRRSAASVHTVHGSSCLQKEMDDVHMIGAGSPEAVRRAGEAESGEGQGGFPVSSRRYCTFRRVRRLHHTLVVR